MNTPEKLAELEHALTKLSSFRTSSVTSIVLMIFGVVVIVGAVVFSASRLRPLENRADELRAETEKLTAQSEQLQAELAATRQKLESVQKQADLVRMGVMDSQSRNYEHAIATYDQAIALDPTNGNVYAYKGYAQYRFAKVPEAIETLKTCSKVDDTNVWCHYNLALAYWANGNHDEAITQVRRTLELDPSFRERFKGDLQMKPFNASPEYQKLIAGDQPS